MTLGKRPPASHHRPMTKESQEQTQGIPAATVVIFRNGQGGKGPPEILMTVRSRSMTFAGGMAVFPGGRVDRDDYALAESLQLGDRTEDAAHRIAAIRETLEETGLAIGLLGKFSGVRAQDARARLARVKALAPVLQEFDWSLDLDALIPFARWFPKNEQIPRVYDTRFYLCDLGTGDVEIAADNSENTRLFWVSAQGALDMADRKEIELIFPTRRNLERLALFANFAEARAQAQAIPVRPIIPRVDDSSGKLMLTIMEDAGYPVTAELLETVQRG